MGIEEKKRIVNEIKKDVSSARAVLIADVTGVPCGLLNEIRSVLRGRARIKVVKKNVLYRALEGTEAEKLSEYVEGSPAIIFADDDPLSLYSELSNYVSFSPLKAGSISPVDVVVEKGPTGLPAPMLGELKSAGIPARVNKGVIEIEEEKTIIKKGDLVTDSLANTLLLLGIKPIKRELKVTAAYENGVIYTRAALMVDRAYVEEKILESLGKVVSFSRATGYFTRYTVKQFIAEAYGRALSLAVRAGVITPSTARAVLLSAYSKALALRSVTLGETRELPAGEEDESAKETEDEGKKEEQDSGAALSALFG